MDIIAEKITNVQDAQRACASTTGFNISKASLKNLYRCEHSPIRTQIFWIQIQLIPSFVSVHFTRHKIGVEHFVQSKRSDRQNADDKVADRDTLINHSMMINAHSIMHLCRERLCYKADAKTLYVMRKIKYAIKEIDSDLFDYLVPKCVYRNGICPEIKECKLGVDNLMSAYEHEVNIMRRRYK